MCYDISNILLQSILTLNLLTTTIVTPPSNASKWQVGFNSAFKGLKCLHVTTRRLRNVAKGNYYLNFRPSTWNNWTDFHKNFKFEYL
jgi:hypothetical protein